MWKTDRDETRVKISNLSPEERKRLIRECALEALMESSEDWCTSEGGHWVTIQGTHICIKKGESPEQAFKRTTGRDLDSDTAKDINKGGDKDIRGVPRMELPPESERMLGHELATRIMTTAQKLQDEGKIKTLPRDLGQMAAIVNYARAKNIGDFSLIDSNDVMVAANRLKQYGDKAFPVRRH